MTDEELEGERQRVRNNIAYLKNEIFLAKYKGRREAMKLKLKGAQDYEANLLRRINRRVRERHNAG